MPTPTSLRPTTVSEPSTWEADSWERLRIALRQRFGRTQLSAGAIATRSRAASNETNRRRARRGP